MYKIVKRIMDLLLAVIALIILMPIFILVTIILLITGEHEVFFFQKRIGFQNKPFYIWKFATMLKNSPNMGTGIITLRHDPRVTPFGKFLRISKINELPQIINVILGNMSIVGPRPLMQQSFELYDNEIRSIIYKSKPGITGIGSLVFRDEEKIISLSKDPKQMYQHIYPYKGALEMWYYQHASFLTDSKIIILTAYSVLFNNNNLTPKIFKDLPENNTFNLNTAAISN
ncbi:MAG: sugar transferase [Ginsengibacter sp.]